MQDLNGKDLTIRDLKKKIRDLQTENRELLEQLDRITRERDHAQYCLEETRKSFSYKLGYMLTAIPRKLRSGGNSSSK